MLSKEENERLTRVGPGTAMGKLLRPGREVIDSAGHLMYACGWAVNRGEDRPDSPQYGAAEEVFGVTAAAALYRRALLEDVAPDGEVFDSSFFSYVEDVDLDWRARLRGWTAWYEPAAVAIHQRSATGARGSAAIQRHILKNRLLTVVKNEGGRGAWRRLPAVLAFTAVKSGQLLVTQPTALAGVVDFARLLPAAVRKRRVIQSRRTASVESWFQPGWWRRR